MQFSMLGLGTFQSRSSPLGQKCNSSILHAKYLYVRACLHASPPSYTSYYILLFNYIHKGKHFQSISQTGQPRKIYEQSGSSATIQPPELSLHLTASTIESWSGLSCLTGQRRRPADPLILEDHMPAACAETDIPSQSDHPQAAHARGNKQPAILALDFGQRKGWASRNHDGPITSGVQEFRHGRSEGGMTMAQVIGGAR